MAGDCTWDRAVQPKSWLDLIAVNALRHSSAVLVVL